MYNNNQSYDIDLIYDLANNVSINVTGVIANFELGNIDIDADANILTEGTLIVSHVGNIVANGTSLINVSGSSIVSSLGNIDIDADANIDAEGTLITSSLGNILVFAKYKISKFNKNEIDIKFNKNEKELIFSNQDKHILTFKSNEKKHNF